MNYPQVAQTLSEKSIGTLDRVPEWQTVNYAKVSLPELRAEQQDGRR